VEIYGHSIGNNVHDIGAWTTCNIPSAYGARAGFAMVRGEWHSVDFHVSTPIPEWGGKTWYARFEENAAIGPNGVEWLIPRQEKLILIPFEATATNSQK